MRLSEEQIEAGRSPKGGWSRKQLAEWGVSWPPSKGWKRRLLGWDDPKPAVRWIEIRSRFGGHCSVCSAEFGKGDLILWSPDDGPRCVSGCLGKWS